MASETGKVSGLLEKVRLGEEGARAQLMEAVHGELRQLARRYMRQERLDHTLQPTALVHEAYLRLFPDEQVDWEGPCGLSALRGPGDAADSGRPCAPTQSGQTRR